MGNRRTGNTMTKRKRAKEQTKQPHIKHLHIKLKIEQYEYQSNNSGVPEGHAFLSNASCNCGAPCENSHHFVFDCDKYTDNKEILFNSLNWLPSNIDVNLLTKGSDFLKY